MSNTQPHESVFSKFQKEIRSIFQLRSDTDKASAIQTIHEGVDFHGTNVWSLVIAIVIASIGLNLNSPAVIIGAMLISPLMGPIMGTGLALGINDVGLLKKSLINLAIMTAIALAMSTVYFSLTPLNAITAELQARTSPTFYDVLIAFFGGSAMIIGISRKSKSSNLIAGVAIATALMPPLCTAGFGIATRNWGYFFGAAYLYLINSVFIGMATFLFSKALGLSPKSAEETPILRKRHMTLTVFAVIVFVAPSFFIAYGIVQESTYESNVTQFIDKNLKFGDTQVLSSKTIKTGDTKTLEILTVGEPLSDEMVKHLQALLPSYHLNEVALRVVSSDRKSNSIKPAAQETAAQASPLPRPEEAARVPTVATGAVELSRETLLEDVSREVSVLFPEISNLSFGDLLVQSTSPSPAQKKATVFVRWKEKPQDILRAKVEVYLKLRFKMEDLSVVNDG